MSNAVKPVIENWYRDLQTNLIFKVVAIDETDHTIEVQYRSGDIGEYDWDFWFTSNIIETEQAEDWSAAYDLESEDADYANEKRHFSSNSEDVDLSDFLDKNE